MRGGKVVKMVLKAHRAFRTKQGCGECPFKAEDFDPKKAGDEIIIMNREGRSFRRLFCTVYHITQDPGAGWRHVGETVDSPEPGTKT